MANKGSAVVDFGAFGGSNEASVAISDAAILAGSLCDAWIVAKSTSDHTVNDHTYAALFIALTCGVPTASTGFTIYARSTEKMQGTFNIEWAWS